MESIKYVLIAVAVAIAIMIVGAFFWVLTHPDPPNVVIDFLQTEVAGDYDVMRRFVTANSVSIIPPDEQLPPRPKSWIREWNRRKVEIGDATISGDKAQVPVKAAVPLLSWLTAEPVQQSIQVMLVREGRQWKIDLRATHEQIINDPSSQFTVEE